MTWTCRISKGAAQQLGRLPKDGQQQVSRAIDEMRDDPLRGDVRPIKTGRFRGALRKRAGRYRLIFSIRPQERLVEVAAILVRTEKTYR